MWVHQLSRCSTLGEDGGEVGVQNDFATLYSIQLWNFSFREIFLIPCVSTCDVCLCVFLWVNEGVCTPRCICGDQRTIPQLQMVVFAAYPVWDELLLLTTASARIALVSLQTADSPGPAFHLTAGARASQRCLLLLLAFCDPGRIDIQASHVHCKHFTIFITHGCVFKKKVRKKYQFLLFRVISLALFYSLGGKPVSEWE